MYKDARHRISDALLNWFFCVFFYCKLLELGSPRIASGMAGSKHSNDVINVVFSLHVVDPQ